MPHINFVKNLKNSIILSAAIMLAIIVGLFVKDGVTLDIEFRGGSIITYSYTGEIESADFEAQVRQATETEVSIQKSENIASGQTTIVLAMAGNKNLSSDELIELTDALTVAYPDSNLKTMEINNVDPTIGGEFLAKCLVAVLVASVLLVVYVAFRFRKIGGISAGFMAILALVHDVAVAFGVFVLLGIPINSNFIAVVLTILGFSLNDTIVIYDRIRENEKLMPRNTDLAELVDLSINQSFKRSLITSVATVMAMVVVTIVATIYKVDTILSFSTPLIIGLISGSYSTICLAGPLWVKWQEHKLKKETRAA